MLKLKKEKLVYLDGAANTPLDKRVFKAMKPYLVGFKGNSNAIHDYGIKASKAVENARESISRAIGNYHKGFNVYFDSGATEGNNWIVLGLSLYYLKKKGPKFKKDHLLICSSTEHASIINGCKFLKSLGFNVEFIKPNDQGIITDFALQKIIQKNQELIPYLICVGAVNNETGAINQITPICQTAHRYKAKVLVDCTQAMSCGGSDVKICQRYHLADYMTFSSHKLYGPTGVGCLIKKKSAPLPTYMFGGNQEDQSRGGTHNVAGIVGMSKALELLSKEYNQKSKYYVFSNYLDRSMKILSYKYGVNIFSVCEDHVPNIIDLYVSQGVQFTELANQLGVLGIACSAGSACSNTDKKTYSHVLLSMGYKPEQINNVFRVSFTKDTSLKDIDRLSQALGTLISAQLDDNKDIEKEEKKENNENSIN